MEDDSDIHGKVADCGNPCMEPNLRIKQLTDCGNSVDIDTDIPPRRYYRSGLEMVRMANVYLEEGSLENAFILYMKFMTLFLEKIRTHPDFATVSVTDRATNSQKLREVMPQAENLKSLLLERYTKEYQKHLELKRRREAEERAALERRKELEELEIAKARSLKTKEEEDEREWMSDKEKSLWINGPIPMPNVNPEGFHVGRHFDARLVHHPQGRPSSLRTMHKSGIETSTNMEPLTWWKTRENFIKRIRQESSRSYYIMAVLPALDSFFSTNDFEDDFMGIAQPVSSNSSVKVPDRTLKPVTLELPSPTSDLQPRGQPRPNVDRSTKPPSLLLSPSSMMIHSAGRPSPRLRMVVIPSRLMRTFLALAQQNTQCNVETCGILAGKLHRDQLIVTHLLVPKQTGTADSCTTKNEEEIFDYQDQHDLITLGWIHTHPSQTAFLSSVDLHTHCSYQRMMPEAVAVVCAPRYNETGFYVLTPDYGLDFIANCRQTGFHPHPSKPPLFMEAEHTKLNEAAVIEVVDLRR